MNEALQTLEVKVENNGTTPQGKIFAREWNVMVEAVKALDLKEFDEAKLLQYLRDNDFITSEDIPDVDFSNVVTLSGRQKISGAKDFVGGIKVNGMPITYNAELGVWEFTGDLLVTGAITMFGSLSGFRPSTVTEAVEVDGETIVKTKNSQGQWQLTAIGGGSGTGGGISAAEVNILISNALEPYALSTSIPTDNKQLSNGAGYATVSDLDTRINNLINGAPAAYDTLKEIADVLAGNVNSIGDILTALDTKATKTYVDTELTKYVKLATAQPIDAQHNFVNGLQIGGLPITKSASANNTIYLDANLVVSGAITMFGSGSTTFPTIWANIPFDLNTMEWTGTVWRVKGGAGSSLDANAVNALISEYLRQGSYATISDISSALVGYATQSWVGDNYLSKKGGVIQTAGVADFTIYRTNGVYSAVHFYNTQDGNKIDVGYLGAASDGRPVYINAGGGVMDLIHSGNIGQYAYMSKRDTIPSGEDLANLQAGSYWVYQNLGAASAVKLSYSSLVVLGNSYYSPQMNISHNAQQAYIRGVYNTSEGNSVSDWHELAFTDSNVASATKLQTPRTIWGQGFDGTQDLNKSLIIGNTQSSLLAAWQEYIGICVTGTGLSGWVAEFGNGTKGILLGCRGNNYDIPSIGTVSATDIAIAPDGGNVVIGGTETGSCKLRIVTTRSDTFSWVLGDLASKSDFALEFNYNDVYRYGLYSAINYFSGDVGLQVGRSDGETNAYNLVLNPLGGNIAIGGTTADAKLHVHGNLLTTGVVTMFSQASLKNEVDRFGLTLEQLSMIEPVRFTWKDNRDSLVHAGGIADEVMRVLPEVVHRTKGDKLTMDYGSAGFFIAASLIKPVIDHEQRLQSAEKEIIDLKAENKRLREQLRVV